MEVAKSPAGAHEVLVAGQARRRGTTPAICNLRALGRMTGLKWEDWQWSSSEVRIAPFRSLSHGPHNVRAEALMCMRR